MSHAILVVGAPRSGSSCVAGILHRLGVRMTLREFMPPRFANPTGFYEDADLVWLLAGPNVLAPQDATSEEVAQWERNKQDKRQELIDGIRERCQAGVMWGAKSYMLTANLDVVISACTLPVKIVRTIRPAADSVKSWRNAFGQGGEWINELSVKTERTTGKLTVPKLNVQFATLINQPRQTVQSLADFVGLPINEEAVAFVDPSLRSV